MSSRQLGRIFGARAGVNFSWSKWGFRVGYSPGVSGNANSRPHFEMPCGDAVANDQIIDLGNTEPFRDLGMNNGDVREAPLVIYREEEVLENGRCIIPGRQSLGSVSNSLSLGYSFLDSHSVSVSLSHRLGFMAPLADRPELQSEFASNQNFSESTSGNIGYSYSVPIDTPLSISTGISSGQPAWTMDGKNLRFPWFDFVSPNNNFTSFYLSLSVGI
jgi:hypothetical protein